MRQIGIRTVSLAVIFSLFIGLSTYGQQWRNFTTADGLADNNVTSMLEDQNGNLWFGTEKGLSQFNGLFTTHLSGMWISSLLESSDGTLWAGGSGLHSYDGTRWQEHLKGMWIRSLLESSDGTLWAGGNGLRSYDGTRWQEHLKGMNITSLLESSDGKIWAGTFEDGLYSYDGATWQEHLSGMIISSLLESKDGKIWAGTQINGLHSYDGTTWKKQLSRMYIYSLLESSDGTLWAGTQIDGLHSYDRTRWQEHLTGMFISSLLESSDGKIWAGTFYNGLYSYDGATWKKQLSGMMINSLLEDKDDKIWAGTYKNGLYFYVGTTWQEQLSGIEIFSLLESSDGKIWAGTQFNGLHSYDGTTWQGHLTGMLISSLLESSDGTLWAGTWHDGLYSYNGTTWTKQLSRMYIYSLLESSDGKVWAGTFNGLYSYDGATWQEQLSGIEIFSLLESSDGKIWAGGSGLHWYNGTTWKQLSEMQIYSLLESSDGKFWTGTFNGLYSYDGTTWEKQLSGIEIFSLLESSDGKIWAGTFNGLHCYDGVTWQTLTVLDGLPSNNILSILEYSDGNLWLGTSNGIGIYKPNYNPPLIEITNPEERVVKTGAAAIFIEWRATDIETETPRLTYQYKIVGNPTTLAVPFAERATQKTSERPEVVSTTPKTGATNVDPNLTEIKVVYDSKMQGGYSWVNSGEGEFPATGKPRWISPTTCVLPVLLEPNTKYVIWLNTEKYTNFRGQNGLPAVPYKLVFETGSKGGWSKPTPVNSITTPPMNDGEHTFYVRAIDRDLNYSEPATITIIVDTVQPNVLIGSPTQGAIVGGTVKIMGGVTDSDLDEFRVEYAVGEVLSDGDFKLIRSSSREIESGQLAEWDTKSLDETQYTIRVHASDKLGHTREDTVTVTLDNTPPVAKLITPQDGVRLTKQTEIIGEVNDQHLDDYVLEYTTELDLNTAIWRQIFKTPESLTETKVPIHHDWEVPTITGTIFVRLTAIDAAGNTDVQIVSVEVPQALTKDKGGNASSSDGNASLYIPPRSLPSDTIITINSVSEQELKAHPGWEAAYDFEPFDLKFNKKPYKPATITLRYPAHLPEAGKTLAIYRFKKQEQNGTEKWVSSERLGGTLDNSNKTITSATNRLGRFVVMQEPEPTLGEDAKITQLTCQPRIFSPKGGGFDTRTAISFNLTKSARVTIKIYNRAGKLKRLLKENKEMPKGVNVVFWDGRDDDNNIVKSDLYIVTITAGDTTVIKTVAVSNR